MTVYLPKSSLKQSRAKTASRGAAEIELILVIPLLLTILFLLGGAMMISSARISNTFNAEELAYRDATVSPTPLFDNSSDLDPTLGEPDLQNGFPNKMSVSNTVAPIHVQIGTLNLPPFTIVDKAAFATPAWAYSNWPNANDAPQIDAWMQNYNDQYLSEYQGPLDLAPAWPP